MSSNQDPMYSMANPQNGIYPNMIHANNFDFIPDMDPSKQQQLNTAKLGGYDATYRPIGYTTNTIRQRHQPNSSLPPQYRENYYQNSSDMFNVAPSVQLSASSAYDYTSQTGQNFKQYPDPFIHSSQVLPTPHPLANINGSSNVAGANKGFNPHTHFVGGVQLTSQTPFGPHIPVNVPNHMSNGLNNASNGNVTQSATAPPTGSIATGQEEISTIFVVGFPDDMQEREFQNMFTFSQGFEAATLKIPNKDNTNYTGRPYGASGDPFNLVTPNHSASGVVDGGRDGNWPSDESSVVAQFGNNGSAPPRKQIIGFAKFRTRQDALVAKDLLQGKRIDMEKGAVLKAEMAKKNLHTKRGVGTMPIHAGLPAVTPGTASMSGMPSNFGIYQQANINGFNHGPDPYTSPAPDSLNAPNGLGLKRQTLVHDANHNMLREEDEARRRDGTVNSIGFGSMTIRAPRADEEERERRKDKEFRLRNGAPAFDPFNAFHPQSYAEISRQSVNANVSGLRSVTEVNGSVQHDTVGPWDNIKAISAQQTPARSASPTLSAPQLPTSALDAPLTMERRSSSGPRYLGGESESQSDGDYYPVEVNEISKSFNVLSLSTTAGDTSPQLPSPASNASSTVSRSIDQNPPINTLYVGNLPSGVEQLEEKLRELFAAQPGFRRLCFRQKNNGPMCFVEFDDVSFATKALNSLHSHTLDGLVKGTGIRLSYSKNPLGVRTPTSAGGQQQQLQHAVDALQYRPVDDPLQAKPRRDATSMTSPVINGAQSSFGNSFLASPPPRFYSSSPSMLTSFTSGTSSQPNPGSSFPRNSAPNILNLYNPPFNFAPFGFPNTSVANIPDSHGLPSDEQNLANPHSVQQHYHRVLSPPTVNLEAARAG